MNRTFLRALPLLAAALIAQICSLIPFLKHFPVLNLPVFSFRLVPALPRWDRFGFAAICLILFALAACTGTLQAGVISLPNGSFESPPTTYAAPFIDSWQQTPQPDLGDPTTWQTGVFSNVPPPIDNCDRGQAAFLIATNNVALAQDYDSTDYANPTPTHAFNATFEAGKSYTLTVGVIGGGGAMNEGVTLELSLYYRDPLGNIVNVAATNIAYTQGLFPSHYHFVDFQVCVPTVLASDPWAGHHIGVQLLSAVSNDLAGGYWDLDNVRLVSAVAPVLLVPAYTNAHFTFTLQSEPGLRFDILASTNLALPLSNWLSLGILTNTTGATPFLDPATNLNRRFYRARQLP